MMIFPFEIGGLSGNVNTRYVILKTTNESMTLPVPPYKYTIRTAQDNKIFDVLDTGERLIFGNSKLKNIKFGSFFPATKHRYSFASGDTREPDILVAQIEKWRTGKTVVRLIITESPININVAIMDFEYHEKDGTRDIYYDITLSEYKEFNTAQANNDKEISDLYGLRTRADNRTENEILSGLQKAADAFEYSLKNTVKSTIKSTIKSTAKRWGL